MRIVCHQRQNRPPSKPSFQSRNPQTQKRTKILEWILSSPDPSIKQDLGSEGRGIRIIIGMGIMHVYIMGQTRLPIGHYKLQVGA